MSRMIWWVLSYLAALFGFIGCNDQAILACGSACAKGEQPMVSYSEANGCQCGPRDAGK